MSKKLIIALLMFIVGLTLYKTTSLKSHQTIITTSDFAVIEKTIAQADKNALIVFDVDDVLQQQCDEALCGSPEANTFLESHLCSLKEESKETMLNFISNFLLKAPKKPVNGQMVTLIKQLQDQHIKTVALTHCETESFGHIISMKEWRLENLHKLGYHFEHSWPDLLEKRFENLQKSKMNGETKTYPLFKDGVLLTNGVDKGLVLNAFLEYAQLKPSLIIFIDDYIKNHDSVKVITTKASIPFIGIHYTAAAKAFNPNYCKKRAAHQFKTLKEQNRWLSDAEADE